jgi:hypothetical protein
LKGLHRRRPIHSSLLEAYCTQMHGDCSSGVQTASNPLPANASMPYGQLLCYPYSKSQPVGQPEPGVVERSDIHDHSFHIMHAAGHYLNRQVWYENIWTNNILSP